MLSRHPPPNFLSTLTAAFLSVSEICLDQNVGLTAPKRTVIDVDYNAANATWPKSYDLVGVDGEPITYYCIDDGILGEAFDAWGQTKYDDWEDFKGKTAQSLSIISRYGHLYPCRSHLVPTRPHAPVCACALAHAHAHAHISGLRLRARPSVASAFSSWRASTRTRSCL